MTPSPEWVLLVAREGPVTVATLNRPYRRNALNLELSEALLAFFAERRFPQLAAVPHDERPKAFLTALADLMTALGMPRRLRDVGIAQSDLARMAAEAMKQTRLLTNNPTPVLERDAFSIYSEAW